MDVVKVPRVTEVLATFSNFRHVPQGILDKAADRGTAVHSLCSGVAKGAWIPEAMVNTRLLGYYRSFMQWREAQVKEFKIIEKRYTSAIGYSGQLDAVIEANDDYTYLIDYKTSAKEQLTYPIQMAAYEQLLREVGVDVDGAMIVYLNKDGEFPDIHVMHDFIKERHIWFSALDCWKYFNKKKGERKNGRSEAVEHISADISDNGGIGLHTEGVE